MAQSRSVVVPLLFLAVVGFSSCRLLQGTFVPAPAAANPAQALRGSDSAKAAVMAAMAAGMASSPALAIEEEDSFDYSLLIVLALPLTALGWALFNVYRVGFRQLQRIGESESGSSKFGLGAED
eukprot:TRINITY_DN4964_c0_g6_i1.p1 TRINITY_DN4964_c0_g6~~TRINITY_DN4964_c0_g6_i1.p1  ORF type:complete len:124 (+),score=41.77 TRINITY_DN4964_c0_g6_i1:116-487(+)